MTQQPKEVFDQFPPLPGHEATWRAIYLEPVMCSGERITVAVIAFDLDGCEALKTLSPERLNALFGSQANGMDAMIDIAVESVLRHGQAGTLEDFSSPFSGVYVGQSRNALGDSRQDVLDQAASLSSCLYSAAAHD